MGRRRQGEVAKKLLGVNSSKRSWGKSFQMVSLICAMKSFFGSVSRQARHRGEQENNSADTHAGCFVSGRTKDSSSDASTGSFVARGRLCGRFEGLVRRIL